MQVISSGSASNGVGADARVAFGLAGDGSTDDTYKLNVGLAALSTAGGGRVVMKTGANGFYFNGGIKIPSNISMEWASNRVYGPNGWTKVIGHYDVTDPTSGVTIDLSLEISSASSTNSSITGSGSSSSTTLAVSDGTQFAGGGGDIILVLSQRDAGGSVIPRHLYETITTARSSNNLTVQDALPVTFSSTITNAPYLANFGQSNRTYVYKIKGGLLTANASRGDFTITMASTTGFAANDTFQLKDNSQTPSGIDCNQENIKVAEVISATVLRLQNPLMGTYTTANKVRILKWLPVKEAWQYGRGGVTKYAADQTDANYHANFYSLYENCGDERLKMDNTGTYKSLANFIRVELGRFYRSSLSYFTPTTHLNAGEGYHYGVYGATFAKIFDGYTEGARHGYLLFKSARGCRVINCDAVDCLTAAFDSHAGGESDNQFVNCNYYGRSNRDLSGNDTGFKFGNPTHRTGPYDSSWINCHAMIEYVPALVNLANNPVATTNGSGTVVITDTAHQLHTGDTVTLAGLATTNNISSTLLNTSNTITVIDANSYSIASGGTANATSSGGGAAGTRSAGKSIGFELVPPATRCRAINCTATGTEIGFRAIQNSSATSDITTRIMISGFKTYDVRKESILIDGSATTNTDRVSIAGVEIYRGGTAVSTSSALVYVAQSTGFAKINGVKTFDISGMTSTAYAIRVVANANVVIDDFNIDGSDRGIRCDTNTGYVNVGPGTMSNLVNGTILHDAGDNTLLLFKNVDFAGIGLSPVMGGTKSTGRINIFAPAKGRQAAGNATVNFGDYYIGHTSTSAARTDTLPDATSGLWDGKEFLIKDESNAAGTNNITLTPTTSTIDYGVINTNGGSKKVRIDGGNYYAV